MNRGVRKFHVRRANYTFFLLFISIVFATSCSRKKEPGRDEQMQLMLTQFFTVQSAVPGRPDGLWTAEKDSVSAMVEKKFLSAYEAKPDEMKKEEIRERLKSLVLLYRIEGRQFAMLTQVADSVGVNVGDLAVRPSAKKGEMLFDARVKGKDGEIRATLKYFPQSNPEKLEYTEGGFTIVAIRESRSTQELVKFFSERMKNTTSLPQY